jgi:glycosyltransferase involved in cell wall biosynthesis
VIAHYIPAIPAALRAKRRNKAFSIFDAEDFHRGEEQYFEGMTKQAVEAENKYYPQFEVITTASKLITDSYREIFNSKKIITINNVFSIKNLQSIDNTQSDEKLKLFWFSQYIGPKRGLDVIFDALNILNDPDIELHLLGNSKYPEYLEGLLSKSVCRSNIHIHGPVPENEIFNMSAHYQVGLASEIPFSVNRNICMTNKIFTYLISGNCILASDTAAQSWFMHTYPGIGMVYQHDNAKDLAEKIRSLKCQPELLKRFRLAALALAREEMNWEKESEKFIEIIESFKIIEKTS